MHVAYSEVELYWKTVKNRFLNVQVVNEAKKLCRAAELGVNSTCIHYVSIILPV